MQSISLVTVVCCLDELSAIRRSDHPLQPTTPCELCASVYKPTTPWIRASSNEKSHFDGKSVFQPSGLLPDCLSERSRLAAHPTREANRALGARRLRQIRVPRRHPCDPPPQRGLRDSL